MDTDEPEVEVVTLKPAEENGLKVAEGDVTAPQVAGGETCSSSKNPMEEAEDDASDPELDELLDKSLGEFGKYVPPTLKPAPNSPSSVMPKAASSKASPAAGAKLPSGDPYPDSSDFEDIFNAAEAEAQLDEVMKMFSSENPELWKQLESFSKSVGLDDLGKGPIPPPSSAATKGESSVDARMGAEGTERTTSGQSESSGDSSLAQKLDETMKKMQENASKLTPDPKLEGLGGMLNQLDLGSEEGEDQLMKMMQGMMSTLLSKDVLYPSLMELCKQYPDWLTSHRGSVSEEDYQRYCKQLEVMTTICREFEKPLEGAEPSQASSEKILQLMQQLQQYGQPPEDLAGGENMPQAGVPSGLQNLMGSDPQNCTVM